jgi:murein L,D-transpeptidase YafK
MSKNPIRIAIAVLIYLFASQWCNAEPLAEPMWPNESWILIDSERATLSLMHGDQPTLQYHDVAFGRLGTKPLHFAGDSSTPTGEFYIDGINPRSGFDVFFHLNYPTLAHGRKALELGRITPQQFSDIETAQMERRAPPENTPLGGMIGIHGVGKGSLAVHRRYNWTKGCIALDNGQIHSLAAHVHMGMRVVIQ